METENVKTRLTPNGVCAITQFFSAGHNGIDIVGYNGYHICCDELCHSDGVVEKISNDAIYGRNVLVAHDNGYKTFYAHIADGCVYVQQGQKVSRGQRIGFMGATGKAYGGHLHFGVELNGVWIDPLPYINADFPQPKPIGDKLHKGDKVRVKPYAKVYGTSICYETWVYEKEMTVYEEPCGDRVVISYDNVIIGACYDGDLTKVSQEGFKGGDRVRITKLVDYNGVALAEFLLNTNLWIIELIGDRAVLTDTNNIVVCAISTANIKKV